MRKPRDRTQRVPEAGCVRRLLGRVAKPLEAVALAVDRMPQRHERARFGEQQEQHPVDDGQRLLEAVLDRDDPAAAFAARLRPDRKARHDRSALAIPRRRGARRGRPSFVCAIRPSPQLLRPGRVRLQPDLTRNQRAQHFCRCGEHAVAQRSTHPGRVPIRCGHERVQRPRILGPGCERRRAEQLHERNAGARLVDRQIEIDLEVSSRVEAAGVDDPQVQAVEDQGPRGAAPRGQGDGEAPQWIARFTPRRHDECDGATARSKAGADCLLRELELFRGTEPER